MNQQTLNNKNPESNNLIPNKMQIEQFLSKITSNIMNGVEKNRKQKINNEKILLISELQERISSITVIKKRKLINQTFYSAVQQLKSFLASTKNIIQTYFRLILDDQHLMLFSQNDIQQFVAEVRFSLLRSIHNMNRIIIKSTENQQCSNQKNTNQKKKKKRKGKNSKLQFKATGIMHKWILQHFMSPYPSNQDKQYIRKNAGISVAKVNYWFINVRQRTLKRLMSNQTDKKAACIMTIDKESIQSQSSIPAEST